MRSFNRAYCLVCYNNIVIFKQVNLLKVRYQNKLFNNIQFFKIMILVVSKATNVGWTQMFKHNTKIYLQCYIHILV